jgi:hypothetical protein
MRGASASVEAARFILQFDGRLQVTPCPSRAPQAARRSLRQMLPERRAQLDRYVDMAQQPRVG